MSADPRIRWQRLVMGAEDLPRSVRHVGVMIACHLNAQLIGAAALAALVTASGYDRRTVLRATKRLRADGWLRVVSPHRRGRATVYQADVPALLRVDEVTELAPGTPVEVSPLTPDRPGDPVDRRFEVSAVAPDRPLVVTPVSPDPTDEVTGESPLFKHEDEALRRGPVDSRGGASRPPTGDVDTVMAALCPDMQPRDQAQASNYRHLIRQRLEHRSLVDLVRETAHVRPTGSILNPPGLYAVKVPVTPAPRPSAAPEARALCPDHPGQIKAFCGPCRSERLAATS
jgi:hypothetical protein